MSEHAAGNDALPPCSDCVRFGFTAACPEAIAAGCPVLRARPIQPTAAAREGEGR